MRSICRYIHESDTPTPSVLRNEKGQDAGLTSPGLEWHHVREPCLADVPSAGLFFHFFQRREWQGWFLKAASWSTPSPHLINVLYCARAPGSNINTYTHRPGTLCELSAHRGLISSGLEREAAVFELLICIKETAFIWTFIQPKLLIVFSSFFIINKLKPQSPYTGVKHQRASSFRTLF